MRGIQFRFDSLDCLADQLDAGADEQDLPMPNGVVDLADGTWIVAQICAGEESTALAARVVDHGGELRCAFEDRDWSALEHFADGNGPPSLPPSRSSQPSMSVEAPPDSHLLVVDDDAELRVVITSLLQSAGFRTTAVGSAEEALEVLRRETVDLLLVDWSLPGMSGLDLCSITRRDPGLAQVPVCFVSSLCCRSEVAAAFGAGASDYVAKPFRAPELKARILGLLSRGGGGEEPGALEAS